jgi:hypothetical protein
MDPAGGLTLALLRQQRRGMAAAQQQITCRRAR